MNETEEVAVEQDLEQAESDIKQHVISVENPSNEEMSAIRENIKANYDFDVRTQAVNFNFKKSVDKETGIETIREAVQLAIPYPSVEGIISILEGKHVAEGETNKGLELLLEAMENVVNTSARELLYEDTSLNAATFPVDQVSWEHIAHIPKVTRRGGGIPKEVWENFAKDYIEVMPEVEGKSIEQITNAAKILTAKLAQVRTNEPVLQLLIGQLALYAENSPNVEEFQECVAFLLKKADDFLNVTPEELLANL